MRASIQSIVSAFRPGRFPYARFALTLLIGGLAGWGFAALSLPLPWMLGPLVACTVSVLIDLPVTAPPVVRPPMIGVIGVMLGTSFSPGMLASAGQWTGTLLMQAVLLVILAVIGVWYYRRVAGLDPVTAYYAGMPGGMIEMSMMGEESGGDGQAVILIHSARILFTVFTVPFIVQAIEQVQLGPRQASRLSIVDAPASTFVWIVVIAVAGAWLGRRINLPARNLFGPMILSIAVHGSGLTDFVVPLEIVIAAQVMVGCITGCRFLGYPKRQILRILAMSFGATALLLVASLVFCYGMARLTGAPFTAIILALAPAGIAEMALVALALHFDVAFVIAHQLARIALVATAAPFVFRRLGWKADG